MFCKASLIYLFFGILGTLIGFKIAKLSANMLG